MNFNVSEEYLKSLKFIDLNKLKRNISNFNNAVDNIQSYTSSFFNIQQPNSNDKNISNQPNNNLRDIDIQKINFNEVYSLCIRLNTQYPVLYMMQLNEIPLTKKTNVDTTLDVFDFSSEFSAFDELSVCSLNIKYIIIKSIFCEKLNPCLSDIKVNLQNLPPEILKPPKYDNDIIDSNSLRHENFSKREECNYIYNFDVYTYLKDFQSRYKNKKPGYQTLKDANMNLHYVYIHEKINQLRSYTMLQHILSIALFKDVYSKNNGIMHQCDKCKNPAIYYIQQIFEPYDILPFKVTGGRCDYTLNKPFSSQLILLLYTILNRAISYCHGVVSFGFFNLSMNVFFNWSRLCLDYNHIKQKSKMNSLVKLLNEDPLDSEILGFQKSTISKVKIKNKKEYWHMNEKEELITLLNNDGEYFNQLKIIYNNQGKYTINDIIHYKMAFACCTNTSTYKIGTVSLFYQQSAMPQIENPLLTGNPLRKLNDFTVQNDFYANPVLLEMDKLFDQHYTHKLANTMSVIDFESRFFGMLTNNSAGLSSEKILESKNTNKLLQELPIIGYGQRYLTALIDQEDLYNEPLLFAKLIAPSKAGHRTQIDRRPRMIMMVGNEIQVAFSVLFELGKQYQRLSNVQYIMSGKQVGNIVDMYNVLNYSSDQYSITSDLDIRGMDTNTQEGIINFIFSLGVRCLLKNNKSNNFFCYNNESTAHEVFINKNLTYENDVNIPPVVKYLIEIFPKLRSSSYLYEEKIISKISKIPNESFWSGAFHTAVQHNMVLSLFLERLNLIINQQLSVDFKAMVMGDDMSINFNTHNLIQKGNGDLTITDAIQMLKRDLKFIGYSAEPEASRCSSTFLQQTAFYGKVVPKYARVSPVCCEKSDTSLSKNVFERVAEIGSIFDELSGRAPHPEATSIMMRSYFMMNRDVYIKFSSDEINEMMKSNYSKYLIKRHGVKDNNYTLVIPFSGIFLSEIYGDVQMSGYSFVCDNILIPSYYAPRGTILEYYISRIFTINKSSSYLMKKQYSKNKYFGKFLARLHRLGMFNKSELPSSIRLSALDYLDYSLIDKVGLSFAQTLFDIYKKSKVDSSPYMSSDAIKTLIRRGNSHLNREEELRSRDAYHELRKRGFNVPSSIAYFNSPKVRIEQSLDLTISKNRLLQLDVAYKIKKQIFDTFMNYTTPKSYLVFKFQFPAILDIYFNIINETTLPISTPGKLVNEISLGPCIVYNIDQIKLINMFGIPTRNNTHNPLIHIYYTMLNNLPGDPTIVLDWARKINKRSSDTLELYFDMLGFDSNLRQTVTNYLNSPSTNFANIYKTTFNTRKFFYIDTSPYNISDFYQVKSFLSINSKLESILNEFVRGLFFMFPYLNSKLEISFGSEFTYGLYFL